jgi:hypothetical protein
MVETDGDDTGASVFSCRSSFMSMSMVKTQRLTITADVT